jgi:hypothetical protein
LPCLYLGYQTSRPNQSLVFPSRIPFEQEDDTAIEQQYSDKY